MLTAANYAANLKTAAGNAAATAGVSGLPPSEFTLAQRTAYNKALVAQILAYPNSFSPETLNIAATMNTDYGRRGYYFDSALGTIASSVADTATAINPLAVGNIGTVGKYILLALVVLAAFWLFLKTPKGPTPAHA